MKRLFCCASSEYVGDHQSVNSNSSTEDESWIPNYAAPKRGTNDFFFQLLKTDKDARPGKGELKTLDLLSLMEQRSSTEFEKTNTTMSSDAVDLQLRIGSPGPASTPTDNKRDWVLIDSSSDRNQMLRSRPNLIKNNGLVIRAPNASGDQLDLRNGLPVVNEENNNVVQIPSDQWEIKKKLKKSDVDNSSRLLIGLDMVSKYILPHIVRRNIEFDETRGTEVAFWDVDDGSQHMLTFKRWKSTNSFVFVGGWKKDFVTRRNLKEDDLIGLKWDDHNSKFQFTLFPRNSIE